MVDIPGRFEKLKYCNIINAVENWYILILCRSLKSLQMSVLKFELNR